MESETMVDKSLKRHWYTTLFWSLMGCGTWLVGAFAERYAYVLWALFGLIIQLVSVLILIGSRSAKGRNWVYVVSISIAWMAFVVVPIDFFIKEFYVDYELAEYGASAVGYSFYDERRKPVVTETGRRVRYFYYAGNQEIEREVESDIYRSGDSLKIVYSKRHPDLHRILGKLDR